MSAPDTNTEKQVRRHRPALIIIALALVAGALFFLMNMITAVQDEGIIIDTENDATSAPTVAE